MKVERTGHGYCSARACHSHPSLVNLVHRHTYTTITIDFKFAQAKMVLFSLSRRINKIIGPPALRYGLSLRYALGSATRDNAILDAFLLIPFSQKMVSLEVQEDAAEKIKKASTAPSAFDKIAERTFDRLFGKGAPEEYHTLEQVKATNPRMETFESYMRPILVPNEKWSDIMRWQFHVRFVNFVRVEYLAAKWGLDLKDAIEAYPKLRIGPQASATRMKRKLGMLWPEPQQEGKEWLPLLPSTNTIVKAFQLQSWSRKKNMNGVWKRMITLTQNLGGEVIDLPGSWLKIAKIPPDADLSTLSMEEILEVAGIAGISSSGSFNLFCEECNVYQFWTREYIDELADYLLERTQQFEGDTLVLDSGAGDGILAQLLRESFASGTQKIRSQPKSSKRGVVPKQVEPRRKIPEVIAIDDGSWGIVAAGVPVEQLDVADALEKYATDQSRQVIVLCSWMPMGLDFTALFRDYNVGEYILIGEYDDGNCGENWATWGNIESRIDDPEATEKEDYSSIVPLYEAEGYKRAEVVHVSKFHLSRFDSALSSGSKTFSFQRKQKR